MPSRPARSYQFRVLEQIVSGRPGLSLKVETEATATGFEITFRLQSGQDCLLHWGLARRRAGAWQVPPESAHEKTNPAA